VRWLTGAHADAGHTYFVKESYEELLWWLQLPALCKLAAQPTPARSRIQQIGEAVSAAATSAASADYRVDRLFEPGNPAPAASHPSAVGESGLATSDEKSDEKEVETSLPESKK
jgi:hypothetical protein